MSADRDRFSCVVNFGDSLIHNRSVQDVAIFRIYFIFLKKKTCLCAKMLDYAAAFFKICFASCGRVFFFFWGGGYKNDLNL